MARTVLFFLLLLVCNLIQWWFIWVSDHSRAVDSMPKIGRFEFELANFILSNIGFGGKWLLDRELLSLEGGGQGQMILHLHLMDADQFKVFFKWRIYFSY